MLLFAYSLLYIERKSDVSLVSRGSLKRAFSGQWRFSGLFSFCIPSCIWEVTVEQGLLTGSSEIPRDLGKGEIRKPAALQRKKY